MSTWFAYGSFIHAANDVQLAVSKHATFSARGFRQGLLVRFTLKGQLVQQDGNITALTAQMAALENAYAVNGLNCGLYLDAALTQPTQHTIIAGQTIGGTRVVSLEWQNGDGTQYVFLRGYTITLEAEFPGLNNILAYHESISVKGNGGPRIIVLESLTGYPQPQTVCRFTKCTATQRGHALGLFGYLPNPEPIWPDALRNDLSGSGMDSPKVTPNGVWQFPSSWEYSFESNDPLSGSPTIV